MSITKPTAPGTSKPLSSKTRVFLVDDHPIVRHGLAQLIGGEPDFEVCGQGEDVYQALRAIKQTKPDLCLIDVGLKDGDGFDLLKELQAQLPELPVLMLSMHDEALYAERALRAGARGYAMKQEAPQVLLGAIRLVLSGNVYVSEKMSDTLLHRIGGARKSDWTLPMEHLTDRELGIFRLIADGKTVREIADNLCISPKTVESHRDHIKQKLDLKSGAELLRFAMHNSPEA